jgi:cysteine-rich repeat protein
MASSGIPALCGNGVLDSGEGCDDHNNVDRDGCSAACQAEAGFVCFGAPSRCSPVCGDGRVAGGEECDDGDMISGNGCNGACFVEAGWTCTGAPSVCVTACGNRVLDPGEVCDDGNHNNGDGCSSSCAIEPGWDCSFGAPSTCTRLCPEAEVTTLTCGSPTVMGNTAGGGTALTSYSCANLATFAYPAPERVYRFVSPTARTVHAAATRLTNPNADMDLVVLRGSPYSCGNTTPCVVGTTNPATTATEAVDFQVRAGEEVYLVYDAFNVAGDTAAFSLSVTCLAPVCGDGLIEGNETCDEGLFFGTAGCNNCQVAPGYNCRGEPSTCYQPAANAQCSGAKTLTTAGLTGENIQLGVEGTNACNVTPWLQLFYKVTVPAGATLVAQSSEAGVYLDVEGACGATTCASTGAGSGVSHINATAQSQQVILVATSFGTLASTFNLSAQFLTASNNSACATPTVLPPSGTLDGQTLAGAHDVLSTVCLPEVTGPTTYYSLTVPAMQQVTVEATPVGAWTPRIRILQGCASSVCEAASDVRSPTAARNQTNAPRTVVVAVSSSNAHAGAFTLTTTSGPLGYQVASIVTDCSPLPAPTTAFVPGDDVITDFLSLPMPFSLFGQPVTLFAVSSNGFVQLANVSTAAHSANAFNAWMPEPSGDGGKVAPFWDDLLPRSVGSTAQYQVLGAAPNRRLVVEWSNWDLWPRPVANVDNAALSFRTVLVEGSNAVEFHYCQLMGGTLQDRAGGASATVGLEGLGTTRAVVLGHNQVGLVSTAAGYRLVPVP